MDEDEYLEYFADLADEMGMDEVAEELRGEMPQ